MFSLFICLTMDGWIKLNETFRVSSSHICWTWSELLHEIVKMFYLCRTIYKVWVILHITTWTIQISMTVSYCGSKCMHSFIGNQINYSYIMHQSVEGTTSFLYLPWEYKLLHFPSKETFRENPETFFRYISPALCCRVMHDWAINLDQLLYLPTCTLRGQLPGCSVHTR